MSAARAIQERCKGRDGRIPTINAIGLWLNRARKGIMNRPEAKAIYDPDEADRLNQINNALKEANIPIEAIGKIAHVRVRSGFHEGLTKGPEGEPVVTHLKSKHVSILLSPKWEEGPEWPPVQPAAPVRVICRHGASRRSLGQGTGLKTIVVLSDLQIGFLRDLRDPARLVPMHDPAAIDIALQIVSDLKPDQLGYVGDFLDLPEMSRYLQHPEFVLTTQPAIDEGHRILAQFEAAAGPREGRQPTMFVGGNHDRRIREAVLTNARAAFNLRPAQETPESWPDLSIPHLLRFEELGITYAGEYPGGEWWLNPRLVVRHDPQNKEAYDASVIAGHTHHIRRETFTRRTPSGPKQHTVYEIGALCSLDNYDDKRSLLATKVPSNKAFHRNWAQGFAVVYLDGDNFTVDQVEITNGRCIYRGKLYTSVAA